MKILVITDCLPYPLISGDRIRLYNLLKRIAKKHEVYLVSFLNANEEPVESRYIEELCHQVEIVKLYHKPFLSYLPVLLKFVLRRIPLDLAYYYSDELIHKVQKLVSTVNFDIVQIEHSHMAFYLEALPHKLWPKSILTFHNVEFERAIRIYPIERKLSKKFRRWFYGQMMRKWEPKYAERFGQCIAMSVIDQQLLAEANPRLKVHVVSNGIDTRLFQPLPLPENPNTLLFVGSMDYGPCNDAMLFFCNEVLPRIRSEIHDVELWIVGKKPSPEVMKLDGHGVHVTGRVPDVVPYYERSAVCVVPLRAGGGTRLKILEAMGLGRPIVSTAIGCEGLDVVDGKHILIGNSPEQLAQNTVSLLKDRALYDHIAANARQLVVDRYDWDVIVEEHIQVYNGQ